MFIDPTINPRPALQRSAMFLGIVRDTAPRFAPLERGGVFWGRTFYKHYVPTGRGKRLENLAKQRQLAKKDQRLDPRITDCQRQLMPMVESVYICAHLWRAVLLSIWSITQEVRAPVSPVLGHLPMPFSSSTTI